jgi:hypothetical protein
MAAPRELLIGYGHYTSACSHARHVIPIPSSDNAGQAEQR